MILLTYLLYIIGTAVVCSGMKAAASAEDMTVDHGSGDQVMFDQILDLSDAVVSTPALGDGAAPFTDSGPAKSAPLIAFD